MVGCKALAAILFFLLFAAMVTGCGGVNVHVALPQDDAPHSAFNTEWWYYHGHLEAAQGERYAFHYVVFQVLIPDQSAVNVAHLSISDPQNDIYATDQRTSLVSSTVEDAEGFAFDLGGWRMSGYDGHDELSASAHEYKLDLDLEEEKPSVLHQGTGLVNLGEAGESYYYSRTRLVILGTISVGSREVPVTGLAWFDHQWGNFDPSPIGWEWFALQLSDGSDVMLSVVRDASDRLLYRYGTFITPSGIVIQLFSDDFDVLSTGSWTSPASGAVYPGEWRISVPAWGFDVTLMPVIDQCEFDATSTTRNYYWEGEVTVSGTHNGRGFVELTGYASSP